MSGHKTHGLQKIPLFQVIDPADMLDPDLCTPFNVVAVPANSNKHDVDVLYDFFLIEEYKRWEIIFYY